MGAAKSIPPRQPIKFLKSSFEHLGDQVEIPMPPCHDAIIVCVVTNMGLQPKTVRLPHQLYREELKKVLNEPGVESVVIIPIRNDEKIEIKLKDI